MSKKTKIILFSIIGLAIFIFLIAFIINANKKFIVTFDTDGGSYISSQEVKDGSYVSKPTNPTKNGYEFVEWQYHNEKFDFSSKVKEDMTLVAIWEKSKQLYNVELNVDGKKQTIQVSDGKLIDVEKLNFEEKEGFEIEWQLNGKTFDIETEKITGDVSLTGKYVEVKTYTITFDTDGGNKIESQKVNENKKVKKPTDPTKEGYVFDGWYLENTKYAFNDKVTKDITLKAKWSEDKNVKRYTVTFNSDGGSNITSQTIIDGKTASKPNNPTRSGYRFVEWQLNGKTYNFNSKVTSNITLKAVWQQIVTYTVSFNTNGGTSYPSQTITEGGKATNPGNPTKNGYVFTGWDFDFNTSITSNKTVNANWRELYKYTVQFNTNGGSCSNCGSQTITEGGKATNPGNLTRSGYNFNGWDFDFNNVVTSNITINAKWTEIVYTIKSASVDKYSPDVTLSVWNGSSQITNYRSINYSDGVLMCSSSNPTVSKTDFDSETSFTVILNDGTTIRATK